MSKTIKLIELLNKIANGEEVPEKIKYDGNIFKYNKNCKDYILEIDDWTSCTLLYKVLNCHSISEILETNIEIIEDEIDIQEILELKEINVDEIRTDEDLVRKLNSIIARENTLLNKIKQQDKANKN